MFGAAALEVGGKIGKLRTLLQTKNMKNTCFYIRGKRYVSRDVACPSCCINVQYQVSC
jgi:hypothetical protein